MRALATATLSGIIKALPPAELDKLRDSLVTQVPRLFSASGSSSSGGGGGGGGSRKRPAAAGGGAVGGGASTAGSGRLLPVVAAGAVEAAAGGGGAGAGGGAGGVQQQQQQQGAGFLVEAQAVVQGLKAFVLSSPYDVPSWMPAVLMGLVTAANSRNPLVRLVGGRRRGP